MLESETQALILFFSPTADSSLGSMETDEFADHLRTHVTIEELLADRRRQALLAIILKENFARTQDHIDLLRNTGRKAAVNPFPVILVRGNYGGWYHYETFMLKDRRFIYYFPEWNSSEEIPPYLRPEDVVGSGVHGQAFTPDAVERAMRELGINNEGWAYFIYVQDPRIMPYATYDEIPFKKTINRVPVSGGEAQRYNYNTSQWGANGEGVYSPSLYQRAIFTMSSLVRRVNGRTS